MIRVLVRLLLAAFVFCAVFASACEIAVRVLHPTPRVQVIRVGDPIAQDFQMVGDVPIWGAGLAHTRDHPCAAVDASRVVLVGASILYGSGLTDSEYIGAQLQRALDPDAIRWCVRNTAVPAFAGEQKEIAVRRALADRETDVVVVGVWANDVQDYILFNNKVYAATDMLLTSAGAVAIPWLPDAVQTFFFRHSAFWEYATLALAERPGVGWNRPGTRWPRYIQTLRELSREARSRGVGFVLVLFPSLDRPFADAREYMVGNMAPYPEVRAMASAEGIPVLEVADIMGDREPESVRLDTCCHYNAAGATIIGDALARTIEGIAQSPANTTGPRPQ